MNVRIDQSGKDQATAERFDARARTYPTLRIRARAYEDYFAVVYCERACDGMAGIDGVDLPVRQYDIGRWNRGRSGRQRSGRRKSKEHECVPVIDSLQPTSGRTIDY